MQCKNFIHERDKMVRNWAETKSLSLKYLSNFTAKFFKGFSEIWNKFCSFCMDESVQNEVKV